MDIKIRMRESGDAIYFWRWGCLPAPRSHVVCLSCHIPYRPPTAERGIATPHRERARGLLLPHRGLPYLGRHQSRAQVPARDHKLPTGRSGVNVNPKGPEEKGKRSTHVRILLDFISFSWDQMGKKDIISHASLQQTLHLESSVEIGSFLGIGGHANCGSMRK